MIVYTESNFVLELAFQQEEVDYCRELLELSKGKIKLVLPSFSLAEPYWTLENRMRERKQLYQRFQSEALQLARSSSYAVHKKTFDQVVNVLIGSIEFQKWSLDEVVRSILSTSEVISMDANLIGRALQCKEKFDLAQQDAFIFASVLTHAESKSGPKCFVTTNRKDFEDPDIETELEKESCKLFGKFANCLGYVQASLKG